MIWLAIAFLLVSFLVFVMITPVRVEVDTDADVPVKIQWKGILRFQVLSGEENPRLELYIFGFRVNLNRKKKKPVKEKKRKASRRFSLRKGLNLLRSFRVKLLNWNLDTGDYTTNAKLWPLFFFLSRRQYHLNINFNGENRLQLILENRLYRILGAMIKR